MAFFLLGCTASNGGFPETDGIAPDELAVYAATINDVPANTGKIALVHATTLGAPEGDRQLKFWEDNWRQRGFFAVAKLIPNQRASAGLGDPDKSIPPLELPVSMLDQYCGLNTTPYRLASTLPMKYVTVKLTEASNYAEANILGFTRDDAYSPQGRPIERYSQIQLLAPIVRTFSRAAFDPEHKIALLSWTDLCGKILCGNGELAIFVRQGEGWKYFRTLSKWDY